MNEKIKHLTYVQYQKIANSLLKQVGMFENKTLPVNIELIIDKLKIDIIPKKELKRNYDVYGLVVKKISGYDIFIDYNYYMDDKQEVYFRFTLAEELSHIILHSNIFEEARDIESVIKIIHNLTDDEYRKMEQQARNVAGCILLPAHYFDDYVLNYVEENLNKIKRYDFWEKKELSDYIADNIHRSLKLSRNVISKIINCRYSNLLIDKILDRFGSNTFLK